MRSIVAVALVAAGVVLGLALSPALLPTARAADDGGCAAIPENVDLTTLQLVRRQLTSMRWEHNCVGLEGAPTPETITTQANEQARTGWQLASVSVEGGKKVLVCFKRPKAAR